MKGERRVGEGSSLIYESGVRAGDNSWSAISICSTLYLKLCEQMNPPRDWVQIGKRKCPWVKRQFTLTFRFGGLRRNQPKETETEGSSLSDYILCWHLKSFIYQPRITSSLTTSLLTVLKNISCSLSPDLFYTLFHFFETLFFLLFPQP